MKLIRTGLEIESFIAVSQLVDDKIIKRKTVFMFIIHDVNETVLIKIL